MWYLILQMLLPLAAAALLGGWLAHWWITRRFDDVTSEYDRLSSSFDRLDMKKMNLASREDLLGNVSQLRDDVKSIRVPDLTPLHERLIRVENALSNIRLPETNLNPLHERFTRIESRLTQPDPGVQRVQDRLAVIEQALNGMSRELEALNNTDLRPVLDRLDRLENAIHQIDVPEVDLTPIHTDLARLEATLESLEFDVPAYDYDPVRRSLGETETRLAGFIETRDSARKSELETMLIRLSTISSAVSSLKMPDMQGVQERLTRIETGLGAVRPSDLTPVQERLARIEYAVNSIAVPETDLSPVQERLARLEYTLGNIRVPETDLTPVAERIERLEFLLSAIRVPEVDLTPVSERLSQLDYSVRSLELPSTDLSPVTERLRSIESFLRAPNDEFRTLHAKMADLDSGSASLHAKLVAVENAVSGLDRSPVDLTPLTHRLTAIDASMNTLRSELRGMPDLAPIERRLASVQEAVTAFRATDLTPVLGSLRKIDSALDFRAMENRLTSIEFGLAAMHDMLRARGFENGAARTAFAPEAPAVGTRPLFDTSYTPAEPIETRARAARPPVPSTPVPRQPARASDAIAEARRPNDRANLLTGPAFGPADNLEQIAGVGPLLAELLNEIGTYYFWQIADWGPAEIDWVDSKLEHFRGRIQRDDWVEQARRLARLPTSNRRPA